MYELKFRLNNEWKSTSATMTKEVFFSPISATSRKALRASNVILNQSPFEIWIREKNQKNCLSVKKNSVSVFTIFRRNFAKFHTDNSISMTLKLIIHHFLRYFIYISFFFTYIIQHCQKKTTSNFFEQLQIFEEIQPIKVHWISRIF